MNKSMREILEDDVLVALTQRLPDAFRRSGRRFIRRSEHAVGLIYIQRAAFRWAPGRMYATAELGV